MKTCFSFSLLFHLILFNAVGQNSESEFETKGIIKTSLYPFIWSVVNGNMSLSLQYEARLGAKTSYNAVVDYSATPSKLLNWGSVVNQDYIFYIRPQVRKYFSDQIYRGYYAGVFPLYNFRTKLSEEKSGNYIGGGIITGYQFFVKKRYPIEINVWYALHYGEYKKNDPIIISDQTGWESFDQLGFELNLSWPIIKKEK
jgi:hypothetical protein